MEQALEFIADDELLEMTPKAYAFASANHQMKFACESVRRDNVVKVSFNPTSSLTGTLCLFAHGGGFLLRRRFPGRVLRRLFL